MSKKASKCELTVGNLADYFFAEHAKYLDWNS